MGEVFKNGNYHLLIDEYNGKRMAVQFAADEVEELLPEMPELIDVKITDVCNIGCPWCYQDSKSNSVHGDVNNILALIDKVDGNITEIAFGGGDVLEHPYIVNILGFARNKGIKSSNITINFKSINRKPDVLEYISHFVSAIGISIVSSDEVQHAVEYMNSINFPLSRVSFHIIPDIMNKLNLETTLTEIEAWTPESDILFLGYKEMGRGETCSIEVHNSSWALKYAQELKLNVQVDTKYLNKYLNIIKEITNPIFFNIEEGKFSMNIDCVDEFYSVSSYDLTMTWSLDSLLQKGLPHAFANVRARGNLPVFEKI